MQPSFQAGAYRVGLSFHEGNQMAARVLLFLNEDSGQDLIEYALIAGVIALGAIACVNGLSTVVRNLLTSITTSFQTVV